MKTYHVLWEIDVEAESPREAAEKAQAIQQDTQSIATVFDVIEMDGEDIKRIDLEDASTICDECRKEVDEIQRTRRDGVKQCYDCYIGEEGPQR